METTTASFHTTAFPELVEHDETRWVLCLRIPSPDHLIHPTITSFVYAFKYATTWEKGDSSIQVDAVLTTATCPEGILVESTDLEIYRNKLGCGPRIVDETVAQCLSAAPAIKCNTESDKWSHHVDHKKLCPRVCVTQCSNLYLIFHVDECPTEKTTRCLDVEVSVTWFEAPEHKKKRHYEVDCAKEEAERKAKEEEEEKEKQAAEIKAKDEAAAKAKAEADQKAKDEADRKAKEDELKKAKAGKPQVADEALQAKIQEVAEKSGVACPQGFAWIKNEHGYTCAGGGHSLTYEQLGISV